MPVRRLPRTNEERYTALRNAKTKADNTPGQTVIQAATLAKLDIAVPELQGLLQDSHVALSAQTGLTDTVEGLFASGRLWYSHIIQHLNNAIAREQFPSNVRPLYLNADWVNATRRMSPAVLIELLDITGKEYSTCIAGLDPFQPAIFSVAWAGEEQSLNWFHIAREYTEKWHHQQQIREAVNKPGIMSREFYFPLIDTFMQALPHTYRNIAGKLHETVEVVVTSEAGGEWYLTFGSTAWVLTKTRPAHIDASVTIDPDTAWKLFTKAIPAPEAERKITFSGNESLGKPILSMLSVMA